MKEIYLFGIFIGETLNSTVIYVPQIMELCQRTLSEYVKRHWYLKWGSLSRKHVTGNVMDLMIFKEWKTGSSRNIWLHFIVIVLLSKFCMVKVSAFSSLRKLSQGQLAEYCSYGVVMSLSATSDVWRGGYSWMPLLHHTRSPAVWNEGGQPNHQTVLRLNIMVHWIPSSVHCVSPWQIRDHMIYTILMNVYTVNVIVFFSCFFSPCNYFLVCSWFFISTMKWTRDDNSNTVISPCCEDRIYLLLFSIHCTKWSVRSSYILISAMLKGLGNLQRTKQFSCRWQHGKLRMWGWCLIHCQNSNSKKFYLST